MVLKQTLDKLRTFIQEERIAQQEKLRDVWNKPLQKKLRSGETQQIDKIYIKDNSLLVLTLGEGDSRYREGDMLCLHLGDATTTQFVRQSTFEAETAEGQWLVRLVDAKPGDIRDVIRETKGPFYAEIDGMDLKSFYDKALDDVANSRLGKKVLLPLLAGEFGTDCVYDDNYDDAANVAQSEGFNEQQIEAVGMGVGARYLACIQGPPGTGKTRVIGLIARLLVQQGHNVLLTSHTHMAINNALNKIYAEGVPTIKVGAPSCTKALDKHILRYEHGDDWQERPDSGYVIGATPFATCTERLQHFEFDTIIFDEASQITVPLALMAMRKGRRFILVGDHKQLPPVVLSKSVLDSSTISVFAKLVAKDNSTSVMLNQTYRMNQQLTNWPSKYYYDGALVATGNNAARHFSLPQLPSRYKDILSSEHACVFIESPGINTRSVSHAEAEIVVDIIAMAVKAGLPPEEIGVVTPFRSHGKAIRKRLSNALDWATSKKIVTDTVERMQGQERELIILSMCTTDMQFLQQIGLFFFQHERLNVAITRPKTKLIIIGLKLDECSLTDSRDPALRDMVAGYRSLVYSAFPCSIIEV